MRSGGFPSLQLLQISEIINSGIQPLQNLSVLKAISSNGQMDSKDWAHKAISKGLEAVEVLALQILEELKEDRGNDSVYLAGTREPTMADACLIPQLYNARRYDVDLATTCPHLLEVEKRCNKLEWIASCHANLQSDAQV
mmetsp:Transcript_3500/g.12194  ORF Transcript_3500/g.12194 Transcript_3500/m.12194 type:complete len:140 (-) Transcript_3500:182-601(-)